MGSKGRKKRGIQEFRINRETVTALGPRPMLCQRQGMKIAKSALFFHIGVQ